MNGPGDLTVTHSSGTPDSNNCSLVSIIPIVGMSSCRGRAEAFARRLSSKLRTLGTQADDADISQEDEPIINGGNSNTWVPSGNGGQQTVTDLQPLRHETDSFFDFDCEMESPGSPVDECEYLRLIESTSNTPHNSAAESGYACASTASSHSSSDGPYFDVNSENEACTSHLQKPLEHHHQHKSSNHICQTHDTTVVDEVDSTCIKVVTGENSSYQNHKGLVRVLPSEGPDIDLAKNQTREIVMAQSIQENILKELQKQSLEYNDEEESNEKGNSVEVETKTAAQKMPKESGLEQYSNVLNKHSPEREHIEKDNDKRNLIEHKIKTETVTADNKVNKMAEHEVKKETQQVVRIINGHAENGEDVLKIEVEQVPKEELNSVETPVENNSHVKDLVIVKNSSENDNSTTENEKPNKSHLHMETTDDEDDCRPQRVRRCSSLKTGKTPPGTPGRKKIVRFADVLGLDLADIKTFLDEIPNVPKSAYEDLEILDSEPPIQLGPKTNKLLMPLFQQPGGLPNFLDIVREKLVSLENAAVTDAINQTITGSVRVRNLDFHKSVHIRYTLDGWRSFADLQANYVENSCDGFSDTFTFVLFGNSLHIGQRLEFAVRFQCKGQQYWDNNYGANYCFQCLPTAPPTINHITTILPSHHSNNMVALLSPTVGETWCTSFY